MPYLRGPACPPLRLNEFSGASRRSRRTRVLSRVSWVHIGFQVLRSTPSPAVIRIGLRTGDKFPSMKVESSGGAEGGVKSSAYGVEADDGTRVHFGSAYAPTVRCVMHFKPPLATGGAVPDHSRGRAGPGDKVPK
jgi:hypothetical protein